MSCNCNNGSLSGTLGETLGETLGNINCPAEPITIGANCIARIAGKFFLIVEIEVEVPGVEFSHFIIIRLTRNQAERLMACGVRRCRIVSERPTATAGVHIEPACIFIVGEQAFLILDVENSFDEAVLVEISLAEARNLISSGIRRCTVINRPFND